MTSLAAVLLATLVQSPSQTPVPAQDLPALVQQADQGDPEAQCKVGVYYSEGPPEARDMAKARYWFERAAERDSPEGQRRLGRLYDFVDEDIHDAKTAVQWYLLAAKAGDVVAQNNLGMLYLHGVEIPKDLKQGLALLTAAAEAGYALAQTNLASHLDDGEQGVPVDQAAAFRWWRAAADQGVADAQYNVGWGYAQGKGIAQDCELARQWYRRAAEQDFVMAMNNLGVMEGECPNEDVTESLKWLRKAAELGHARASMNLGMMYKDGRGVPRDYVEAVKWLSKGAELGNDDAQSALGWAYLEGAGVVQDYAAALHWLSLAAPVNPGAACNLGYMYDRGWGVTKDDRRAFALYRDSADYGACQFNVAVFYRDARGTPADPAAAYVWFSLADRKNVPLAQARANAMRKLLSEDQLTAAERTLEQWKPKPLPRQQPLTVP